MADQQGNVLFALAQGWQHHWHNVQTIIQIFTKMAVAHGFLQIRIGGGNNPDIDVNRTIASYPFKSPLLQDP